MVAGKPRQAINLRMVDIKTGVVGLVAGNYFLLFSDFTRAKGMCSIVAGIDERN